MLSNDTLRSNDVKRALHAVDNIHEVVLDLAVELEGLGELNDFFSDASLHAGGNGTVTVFLEEEGFDGLENLGHVAHDLAGGVTIGQDIEQVSCGDEVESGEGTSLAVHEIVKGLLAKGELVLHILKSLQDVTLVAEDDSDLLLLAILKDYLDFLVNADEFLGLLGEFLLHFLGADEKVFEERPESLDLSNDSDDFGNASE